MGMGLLGMTFFHLVAMWLATSQAISVHHYSCSSTQISDLGALSSSILEFVSMWRTTGSHSFISIYIYTLEPILLYRNLKTGIWKHSSCMEGGWPNVHYRFSCPRRVEKLYAVLLSCIHLTQQRISLWEGYISSYLHEKLWSLNLILINSPVSFSLLPGI